MPSPKPPKVNISKADLYGALDRELASLKPQQQGPVDPRLQAIANIRRSIQTRKLGLNGRTPAL